MGRLIPDNLNKLPSSIDETIEAEDLSIKHTNKKLVSWDFPGGPVFKLHFRRHAFYPWSGS